MRFDRARRVGPGAEDAELAADGGDFRGDGAAGFDGKVLFDGVAREKVSLERGGAAHGVGDAGQDAVAVGGAEVAGEEGVVGGAGATTERGGEPAAAGDEPVNHDEGGQPADQGEQTDFACRGVGKAGSVSV